MWKQYYQRQAEKTKKSIESIKDDIAHINRHLDTITDQEEIERLTCLRNDLIERKNQKTNDLMNYIEAADKVEVRFAS